MKLLLVAVTLVTSPLAALSTPESAWADPTYDACIDATSSNTGWDACGGAWIRREQAGLDRVLAEASRAASPVQRRDLNAEQRAWSSYASAACRYWSNADAGRENQVLAYPSCRAELIAARTAQLRALATAFAPQ